MAGRKVEILPSARLFDEHGTEYDAMPDLWMIQRASRYEVTLFNVRNHYCFELSNDCIHHFDSDTTGRTGGSFVLEVQVSLQTKKGVSFRPRSVPPNVSS